MRHKRKFVLSASILLSLSIFTAGCSSKNLSASEIKKLPVVQMEGSFAINVDNPKETIGDADYVFLGRVDQQFDTEYRYPYRRDL